MPTRIGNFMTRLGGGDKELLQQVPQERTKFIQMGGVLLTTSGIAVISMTFALHNAIGAPLFASIVLGLVWGLIIVNIDRFLVLSMGSIRSRRSLALITLPRLLLAVVLALVISTPLVLRIFAKDINQQMFTMQLQRSTQQKAMEARTEQQKEANQVLKQIETNKAILAGHLPISPSSPELKSAQAQEQALVPQVQAAQQAEIKAREVWQCELYGKGVGCAGASNLPGAGPIADAKKQTYEADLRTYQQLAGQLRAARAAVKKANVALAATQATTLAADQAQARAALPGERKEYASLEAYLRQQAARGAAANNQDTGLLVQLRALSRATARDPSLKAARLAVLALFFLIEILPVTVKFLLNLGPVSAYESAAKDRDDLKVDEAHIRRAEGRRRAQDESTARTRKSDDERGIADGRSKARIQVEEDMRVLEVNLGKRANKHVASEMEKILDVALQKWSSQVQARLSASGGGSTGSNAGTAGGGPKGNGSSGYVPNLKKSVGLPPSGNLI